MAGPVRISNDETMKQQDVHLELATQRTCKAVFLHRAECGSPRPKLIGHAAPAYIERQDRTTAAQSRERGAYHL